MCVWGGGVTRDDLAEIIFQSFGGEAIMSSSGIMCKNAHFRHCPFSIFSADFLYKALKDGFGEAVVA